MASLSSLPHSKIYTRNILVPSMRLNSRTHVSFSCVCGEPIGFSDPKEKKSEKSKENKQLIPRIYADFEKIGRELKETMSPKEKGDWKDVLLMSLSFAVYVYISQKLVCAYCLWSSMLKNPW
ncbi:hypothetical protein MKW92_028756 [Papaver armeniacum]|nr:hypothetical protein MKW92_028756 [Papaver armeniacum]